MAASDGEFHDEMKVTSCKNSMVFSSLPLAIKWLRDTAKQNKSVRLQVYFYFVVRVNYLLMLASATMFYIYDLSVIF